MNLVKSLLIIFMFAFLACNKTTQIHEEKRSVVLVAYEINTPSRIWVKELLNDNIHEIVISKYRREPNINLNDTVSVTFSKDIHNKVIAVKGENNFDKIPNDSLNKIVSLDNYYKIYKKY